MTRKTGRRATRKRRHYRFGLWAELLCRLSLRLRGYQICAARCHTEAGEIDIIAARHHVVAIIEVKARREMAVAAAALGAAQRQRIMQAARLVLAGRPELADRTIRFDVMLVAPWRWPHHIVNAWGA